MMFMNDSDKLIFWLVVLGLCVLSVMMHKLKNANTTTVKVKHGCGCMGVILIGFIVTGAVAAAWILS